MSLKTKTLLGAFVLVAVAYGYYTYNDTATAETGQDDQSSVGTVIDAPVDTIAPNVETPIEPTIAITTPTVEVKPASGVPNVEETGATEKTGTAPSTSKALVK